MKQHYFSFFTRTYVSFHVISNNNYQHFEHNDRYVSFFFFEFLWTRLRQENGWKHINTRNDMFRVMYKTKYLETWSPSSENHQVFVSAFSVHPKQNPRFMYFQHLLFHHHRRRHYRQMIFTLSKWMYWCEIDGQIHSFVFCCLF